MLSNDKKLGFLTQFLFEYRGNEWANRICAFAATRKKVVIEVYDILEGWEKSDFPIDEETLFQAIHDCAREISDDAKRSKYYDTLFRKLILITYIQALLTLSRGEALDRIWEIGRDTWCSFVFQVLNQEHAII